MGRCRRLRPELVAGRRDDRVHPSERRSYDVWTIPPGGGEPTNLTNGAGAGTDGNSAWSPDGRYILFTSRRSGQLDVYAMNAGGSGQADLTDSSPAADGDPAWQAIPGPPPLNGNGYSVPDPHIPPGVAGAVPACDFGGPHVITHRSANGTIMGTSGDDVICGTNKDDVIYGFGGNDKIDGRGGRDTIYAGPRDDTIFAQDGLKDVIWGGGGDNRVVRDRGRDVVHGARPNG